MKDRIVHLFWMHWHISKHRKRKLSWHHGGFAGSERRILWVVGRSNQSILKEINPEYYCKDWGWSWSSNTLATWYKQPIHWKRPWCWQRLKAGGERGNRGWNGWMASLTQWTWVWANSGRWWRTGKPGVLQSMGSQRVRHVLVTKQQQQEGYRKFLS